MNDRQRFTVMVEIPLSHARLLARGMARAMEGPEEIPIFEDLLASLESAIGLAEIRSIRTDLQRRRPSREAEKAGPVAVAVLESLGELEREGHARLDDVAWHRLTNLISRRQRPRWDHVAQAVVAVESMVRDDPAALARADALQAYVRDTFDALGISVLDEHVLYVAVTTAGLMVEMAENGRRRGNTDRETVRAIANISQTFTAALIDYLPPEARR